MRDNKCGIIDRDIRLEVMTSIGSFEGRSKLQLDLIASVVNSTREWIECTNSQIELSHYDWKDEARINEHFLDNLLGGFLDTIKEGLQEDLFKDEMYD